MRHVLTILLASWILLVVPLFCLGGVVQHLCGDCPQVSACAHEEGCKEDPCGEPLPALSSRGGSEDSVHPGAETALDLAVTSTSATFFCVWSPHEPAPHPPSRANLPLPESSLPLLI